MMFAFFDNQRAANNKQYVHCAIKQGVYTSVMDENSTTDLKLLITNAGFTSVAAFARELDESPQTLNNWIRRGVPVGREFDVARLLRCDVNKIAQRPIPEELGSRIQKSPETVEELFDLVEPMIEHFSDEQLSEFKGWLEAKRRLSARQKKS